MPRLRRKLPFVHELKEQIRGGIWYKSPFYDALRRVPPPPWMGHIKKRDIPKLVFVEDALLRDFELRNPLMAKYDRNVRDEDLRKLEGRPALASAFVDKQLEEMAADKSSEDSYDAARAWVIENGRPLAKQMHIPRREFDRLETDPVLRRPPRQLFEGVMEQQVQLLKSKLHLRETTGESKTGLYQDYRSFQPVSAVRAIQQRRVRPARLAEEEASRAPLGDHARQEDLRARWHRGRSARLGSWEGSLRVEDDSEGDAAETEEPQPAER